MIRLFQYLCVATFVVAAAAVAQDRRAVRLQVTEVTDRLDLLTGGGGNVLLFRGRTGNLLVDSGVPAAQRALREKIKERSEQPLRYLINTHWHFDHVGANEALARAGAVIIAHANVRERLSKDQVIKSFGRKVPALPELGRPALTYRKQMALRLDGEQIVLTHIPAAHTTGDTVVFFHRANVIHTGDLVFNPGYPFIEVHGGGSIDGVIAAVNRITRMGDEQTRIVPGHGPLMTKAELRRYLGHLREFRAIIAREIAAGKDLPTILAAKPTAELDKRVKPTLFPPQRFITLVYESLRMRTK